MSTIYGQRSTENVLQANRWLDIAPAIYNLYPNEAPFITMTSQLKKKRTFDPKFSWFAKRPRADYDQVNNGAGYASAATSVVVDDGSKFLAGDLLRVIGSTGAYGEVMRVTNVSTNTLTVTRGVGSSSAQALVDNDKLLIIGDAQAEGADLPDGSAVLETERYNYTQILRTTTKYTRTLQESKMQRDSDEVTRRREEKTREHKRKIEKAVLWGERAIAGSSSDSPNRKTGGLYYWIQDAISTDGIDNTQNQSGGTITEDQLEQFLETKAFAYGSKTKYMIASPRVITVLNNLVRGRIEVVNNAKEYGIDITTWSSPHGTLKIMRHELFAYGIFQYAALIVDMEQIALRFVGPSDMRFKTDVGLPGLDSNTDEWLSEVGLEVGVPATMALLTNVQTAA